MHAGRSSKRELTPFAQYSTPPSWELKRVLLRIAKAGLLLLIDLLVSCTDATQLLFNHLNLHYYL